MAARVLLVHDELFITAADTASWAHLTISRNPDPDASCYDWSFEGRAQTSFGYTGRTVGTPGAALADIRAAAAAELSQSDAVRLAVTHCGELLRAAGTEGRRL